MYILKELGLVGSRYFTLNPVEPVINPQNPRKSSKKPLQNPIQHPTDLDNAGPIHPSR